MKRIKYIIIGVISLLLFPLITNAASGNITISGTNQAVVGNNVTVTVTISSNTAIGSWEASLNYDKSYLQLVSSNSESGGNRMAGFTTSTQGVKSKAYTFKFKALKKGSTTISIGGYSVYSLADEEDMSMSTSGKTIKIMTQAELEASYSKDNNLKSLGVEGFEITPEFSKDVLEYSVVVPEDTKEIVIKASANDSRASVNGTGTKEVKQGTNAFDIVVRAENGSEKTYKLSVEVKDSNPIIVKVDNKELTVVKIKEYLEKPNAYEETTVKISEYEIPAFYSEITDFTLVGLKGDDGKIALYIYKDGKYTKYDELVFDTITIYPKDAKEGPKGYTKTTISIKGVNYDAYKLSKGSRFAVIYGLNIENGEEGFFLYDKKDNTLIKYDSEYADTLQQKNTLYTYIIIGLFSALVVLFIILVFTLSKKKKGNKKNKEIFEDYDTKKENIIEEKKPRKKKKKDDFLD